MLKTNLGFTNLYYEDLLLFTKRYKQIEKIENEHREELLNVTISKQSMLINNFTIKNF